MIAVVALAIAVLTLGFFLWDRYRPCPHRLEIDTKNTLFARFGGSQYSQNNWGIIFYSMHIVNVSKSPFTLKDVQLRYQVDGKKESTISHVVLTGTVYSPLDKLDVNAAIVQTGGQSIVLMAWNNLRSEIGNHKTIEPGGVLTGSAYFILNFSDSAKLEQLKQIELVLLDYSGRESKHKIEVQTDWYKKVSDAVILNRQFVRAEDGTMNFT